MPSLASRSFRRKIGMVVVVLGVLVGGTRATVKFNTD
jgi:hypothetical protein